MNRPPKKLPQMKASVPSEFRFMLMGGMVVLVVWIFFNLFSRSGGLPPSPGRPPPSGQLVTQYVRKDPIMDFYHPPEKQTWLNRVSYSLLQPYRSFGQGLVPWQGVQVPMGHVVQPINIHTRGIMDEYQQVGILTGNDLSGAPTISPLMGRRSPSGNSRWQYYTMFNGSGSMIPVKLPITAKGKGCSEERGCEELQSGDEVSAEGYGTNFKVTVYPDKKIYYL